MRELENIRDSILQIFSNDEWEQWIHEGLLPAYTNDEKLRNIELAKLSNHCAICRNINGCCFPKNNNIQYPLHPNCHCYLLDIPKPHITAECSENKFIGYVFADEHTENGKKNFFTCRGYDIIDTGYLLERLTKQAEEKYSNGDFQLGKLNDFGQRITIIVEIEDRAKGGIVKFKTGWLVYPDGIIKNATPFTGKIKEKNK